MIKGIYNRLEFLFAVVAMMTGIILILTMPKATGVCWDDETHYIRVLSLCSLVDEAKYEADGRLIANQEEVVTTLLGQKYSFETEREINKELNSLYANKTPVSEENDFTYTFGIYCPAYVVQAGLVLLGRLLNLPFIAVFQLGKLGTLITYVLLMFFSIRKLRYGKALLTVFALIPTNLYMAANYSYDPWVTGWITLGYVFFIAELQNPDKPMSMKSFIMMMASFILGCMPKAIYFALMFPLLFMPRSKFKDKKQE